MSLYSADTKKKILEGGRGPRDNFVWQGDRGLFLQTLPRIQEVWIFPRGNSNPHLTYTPRTLFLLDPELTFSDRRSKFTLYYLKGSSTKNFIIMITDNEYMKFTVNLAL